MGLLHLVGLLLVVAVGSNYALFFDLLQHEGGRSGTDDDTLASLALANLTTVASFGLLATSSIPVLSAAAPFKTGFSSANARKVPSTSQ